MACGPLNCNMFALICSKTNDSIVVDPSTHTATEFEALQSHLDGSNVKGVLLTHGHADHVAGLPALVDAYPNAKVWIHPLEMENYSNAQEEGADFGLDIRDLPDTTDSLSDRQIIEIGETIQLEVVHTPGHAPGHVAFVDRRPTTQDDPSAVIIGGDLLFHGGVGRTDFINSSIDDLFASLRRLYEEFHDESIVLTGHTTPTFLKNERARNPFVASALQRPRDWYDDATERNGWK